MQSIAGIPKQRLWDLLWSHSQIGLAIISIDWHVILANGRFGRIIEYSPSELVGVHVSSITHPDDAGVGVRAADQDGIIDQSKRYMTKSGRAIWCRLTSFPITDRNGETVAWLSQISAIPDSLHDEMSDQRRELDEIRKDLRALMQRDADVHVGNRAGGDIVGNNKNSDQMIKYLVAAIIALGSVVAYIAYTVSTDDPQPPSIQAPLD